MTRTAIPHVVWGTVTLAASAAPLAAQSQSTYAGHGADSVPREKIVKYAPPPLPAEVTRRIQTMLDVRGAVLGLIAPDGKRLFFTWSITGTPNVWRLDGPKGFPVQMTGGEDPTRVAGVTPDGRTVIVSRDVGGQESPGLYVQSADGGPLSVIHHKPRTRAGLRVHDRRFQGDLLQRQRHQGRQLRDLSLRPRDQAARAGLRSARVVERQRPSRRRGAA